LFIFLRLHTMQPTTVIKKRRRVRYRIRATFSFQESFREWPGYCTPRVAGRIYHPSSLLISDYLCVLSRTSNVLR
ncbi:hypothetical protein PENTCL1PPCAC_8706, partial [Pristionchus entomophagus]